MRILLFSFSFVSTAVGSIFMGSNVVIADSISAPLAMAHRNTIADTAYVQYQKCIEAVNRMEGLCLPTKW